MKLGPEDFSAALEAYSSLAADVRTGGGPVARPSSAQGTPPPGASHPTVFDRRPSSRIPMPFELHQELNESHPPAPKSG